MDVVICFFASNTINKLHSTLDIPNNIFIEYKLKTGKQNVFTIYRKNRSQRGIVIW